MKKLHRIRFCLALIFLVSAYQGVFAQSSSSEKQEQGIKVPQKILKTYVGKYQMEEDSILKIFLKGDTLKAEGPGSPPLDLIPITNSRFFLKKFGVDIEFGKNEEGEVDRLSFIRADGQALTAPKVKPKQKG